MAMLGSMCLAGAALSMLLPAGALAASAGPGTVVVLKLDGVVDPFEAAYIKGGIDDANASHAAAVVLTLDTPGGLDSAMRTITQAILNSHVPVITYVSPEGARAASAGTFILLAGSVAAMAPGTNVGAAHPVGVSGAWRIHPYGRPIAYRSAPRTTKPRVSVTRNRPVNACRPGRESMATSANASPRRAMRR